jgi:hypothetical protein
MLADKYHDIVHRKIYRDIVHIPRGLSWAFGRGHPIAAIVPPVKPMSMAPQVAPNATIDIGFTSAGTRRL